MRSTVTARRPRAEGYALIGLGAGVRFVGTAAATIAGLATTAIAVRVLGTSSYGAFAFALSTAVLFGGIGRVGLEAAVARSVAILRSGSDLPRMERVTRGAFTLIALTSVVGALASLAVIELASLSLDRETRLVIGAFLGVVIYGLNASAVSASLARARGRVAFMEVSLLVPMLARLAAVGVLAAFGITDLRWFAAGYAVAAAVAAVASWRLTKIVLESGRGLVPDLGAARTMFTSSLPFAITGLASIVLARFDVVILGVTGTRVEVGTYEPTLKVVEQAMVLVPLLFASQYFPVATRAYADGDRAEFRELYIGLSKLTYIIAFPAVIVLAAFPETILHAFYGADFPASGRLIWLLLPGYIVSLAFGLNSSALAAVGERRALTRTGLITGTSMVVLALALVPSFGATGAAAATSSTFVVMNVAVSVALARTAGLRPFRTDFVLTLLTSAAPLTAALAIRAAIGSVGLLEALGLVLSVSVVWFALLFAVKIVRRDEIVRLLPRGLGAR
jgi:O-antigen/teichoic acid export membrane protein